MKKIKLTKILKISSGLLAASAVVATPLVITSCSDSTTSEIKNISLVARINEISKADVFSGTKEKFDLLFHVEAEIMKNNITDYISLAANNVMWQIVEESDNITNNISINNGHMVIKNGVDVQEITIRAVLIKKVNGQNPEATFKFTINA